MDINDQRRIILQDAVMKLYHRFHEAGELISHPGLVNHGIRLFSTQVFEGPIPEDLQVISQYSFPIFIQTKELQEIGIDPMDTIIYRLAGKMLYDHPNYDHYETNIIVYYHHDIATLVYTPKA